MPDHELKTPNKRPQLIMPSEQRIESHDNIKLDLVFFEISRLFYYMVLLINLFEKILRTIIQYHKRM